MRWSDREESSNIEDIRGASGGRRYGSIGVGGIMNPKDAVERINAGAQWIQIYTGMIYEGPWFIKKIKRRILESFRLNE